VARTTYRACGPPVLRQGPSTAALDVAHDDGAATVAGEVDDLGLLDVGARFDGQLDEDVTVGDEGEEAAGGDGAAARFSAEADGLVEPDVALFEVAILQEAVERGVAFGEDDAAGGVDGALGLERRFRVAVGDGGFVGERRADLVAGDDAH